MYLLIQKPHLKYQGCLINLHPTMYLLIPYQTTTSDEQLANLHPTMYLLILFNLTQNRIQYTFTSHYVSINSKTTTKQCVKDINLHPTMYLLIPCTV